MGVASTSLPAELTRENGPQKRKKTVNLSGSVCVCVCKHRKKNWAKSCFFFFFRKFGDDVGKNRTTYNTPMNRATASRTKEWPKQKKRGSFPGTRAARERRIQTSFIYPIVFDIFVNYFTLDFLLPLLLPSGLRFVPSFN